MYVIIIMQMLATDKKSLEDPSISVKEKDQFERNVKQWNYFIKKTQKQIASINSALKEESSAQQGESCPKG